MSDNESMDEAIRRYRRQGVSDADLIQANKRAEELAQASGDYQAAQQFARQHQYLQSQQSASGVGCWIFILIGIGLLGGVLWYLGVIPSTRPIDVTLTPTLNLPEGNVINGGNLRTKPLIVPETVIGQVCPSDIITFIGKREIDSTLWYHVRIRQTAYDCVSTRVGVDIEGWVSGTLVTKPAEAIPEEP